MYDHVIVPFDGNLESRAVFAPAADLAWRCGAKLVVVSTNDVKDEVHTYVLKSQAMAKSGADIDFWIDIGRSLDQAVLDAVRFRSRPVVVACSRRRSPGVVRKKVVTLPLPDAVLRQSPVPVLVVGPETDVSRGLPLVELWVPIDAGAESRRLVELAAGWGAALRLAVVLVAMVPPEVDDLAAVDPLRGLLDDLSQRAPSARLEVIQTSRPAAALVHLVSERPDAIVLVSPAGGGPTEPLGPFAAELVRTSERAVLLAAPAPERSPTSEAG